MIRTTSICTGFCLALAAQTGLAQEPPDQPGFPDVPVLSPLRVEGQAGDVLPPGSSVVSRDALDQRGIESWEDFARRGDAGINFSRESNSINVRGQDGDRLVTRVDGIRIPWPRDGVIVLPCWPKAGCWPAGHQAMC